MSVSKETLKKRYESTAETYEKKGKREWAYAKNGQGGYHYETAREAFNKANQMREKAKNI